MKLRNKKTGAIYKIEDIELGNNADGIWLGMTRYNSLAELNEDWEDYEEPKDFWYIDDFMIICGTEGEFTTPDLASFTKKDIEKLKAIGNYFETKEEAEKAVEKIKAWKRLKDKGFRFVKYDTEHCGISTIYFVYDNEIDKNDLDLLFGGEE